ncbi:MAG: 50S ribosomal protein L36, partial [Gammaproteobacteria bacterium]
MKVQASVKKICRNC